MDTDGTRTDETSSDFLSALPDELLEYILSFLNPIFDLTTSPLSKRLLPVQQKRLWEELYFELYSKLAVLCRLAKGGCRWFEYTRSLTANLCYLAGEELPTTRPVDDGDFVYLLSRLDGVQEIRLNEHRLIRLVLSPHVAGRFLPNLMRLDIACAFQPDEDPLHPSFYLALLCYPSLRKLAVELRDADNDEAPAVPLPALETKPFLPSLTYAISDLALEGRMSHNPSVPLLFASLPNVAHLALVERAEQPNLEPILRAVVHPHAITALALRLDGPPPSSSFDHLLALFPSVTNLSLGRGFTSPCPAFYDQLRALPLLSHLSIFPHVDIDFSLLCDVISGPTSHTTLRRLTRAFEDKRVWPNWLLPTWHKDAAVDNKAWRAGLRSIRAKAATHGVKVAVGGSAYEGVALEEWYELEEEIVRRYNLAGRLKRKRRTVADLDIRMG
ncbi:hypothetical protein JCM10213_007236 [Rhodosporidiobolus nylandii]